MNISSRFLFLSIFLLAACQAQTNPVPINSPTAGAQPVIPTNEAEPITPRTPSENPTPLATALPATETPATETEPTPLSTSPLTSPVPTKITYARSGKAIIVDHNSVRLFEQIPAEYLQAARDLKIMFADRSVGQNVNEALDCLAAPSWAQSRSYCRRDYVGAGPDWQVYKSNAPDRITFTPDPAKYDRSNWVFEFQSGDWSDLTKDFIENLGPAYIEKADVLSYQFTYFNVDENSDIADPATGFFSNNPAAHDIHDLETYLLQYPEKSFVFWTSSLARSTGSQVSVDFNDQMRKYVRDHNLILFDFADIISHTDKGEPCFDNRDGIEYCQENGECENYPDDGLDLLAICPDYTTEMIGGHLGSVSGGKIATAKAFWVLAAQIAGWTP